MNKAIIDRLNLKETNITFGQTFRHGIKVYEFEDGIFIAEADDLGQPIIDRCIVFHKNDFYYISKELMLNCHNEVIKGGLTRTKELN